MNKLFKLIHPIFKSLIDTQENSKLETVDSEVILDLDNIASISKDLYINIIKESSTLKDYLTWKQDRSCNTDNDKKLDDDTEFLTFLQRKKALLNLNNRRIF